MKRASGFGRGGSADLLTIGEYQLDLAANTLSNSQGEVQLSPLAARLLCTLVEMDREVATRDALIERLWNGNHLVGEPALNRLVSETRKAVASLPAARALIQTVPRKGYRLLDEIRREERARPFRWQRWLAVAATMVLGAALLHWLLETVIGLVWVMRHPG